VVLLWRVTQVERKAEWSHSYGWPTQGEEWPHYDGSPTQVKKMENGLILMGDLPRENGLIVMGDLPKWKRGRVVSFLWVTYPGGRMASLLWVTYPSKKKNGEWSHSNGWPTQKQNDGLIVMGDLPEWKRKEWSHSYGWPTQGEEWPHYYGWPTQVKKRWRMVSF
jgi:hypothetical protein